MTKEYVFNIKPNYNIIFHRGNTQIGVLDFNGPEMTFSGDMDESAILFIEVIANSFKARLEQERAEEREACAQMLEAASKTGKIISCTSAAKAIRARGDKHD
jgi:histidinol phosphatase-like PHP family hydrolase